MKLTKKQYKTPIKELDDAQARQYVKGLTVRHGWPWEKIKKQLIDQYGISLWTIDKELKPLYDSLVSTDTQKEYTESATMTKAELKMLISKFVKEALEYSDIMPGGDKGAVEFAKKVDEFIHDTIEKAQELHDEGTEMMRSDILGSSTVGSVDVQERNRFILRHVGFLKALASQLVRKLELDHRQQ